MGYRYQPLLGQRDCLPADLSSILSSWPQDPHAKVTVPGSGDYLPQLEKLLPYVDVFLPNSDEAELLCSETDPVRQAEFFRDLGANTTVITLGSEGAVLAQENLRLRSGAYGASYVDGSGGGDAFAAGFIYGRLRDLSAADCLRIASALGASCVREIGTTLGVFTRAECERFLAEHPLEIQEI